MSKEDAETKQGLEDAVEEELGISADDPEWAMAQYWQENQLGYFNGVRFLLRAFPVWCRQWKVYNPAYDFRFPESGQEGSVQWQQTMGRITLQYQLDDDVEVDTVCVQLNMYHIEVSIKQPGQKRGNNIGALDKDFCQDIRRDQSWWEIIEEELDGGHTSKVLFVNIAKLRHSGWPSLWFNGVTNPHKRTAFGWTAHSQLVDRKTKQADELLQPLEQGMPEDFDQDLCTGINPENLCTGVDVDKDLETEFEFTMRVHFDEELFETAQARVPLEDFIAADVEERGIQVFMKSDGFTLCYMELAGRVVPEQTRWEVKTVRRWPGDAPKEAGIANNGFYNPALLITFVKADVGMWETSYAQLQTPKLAKPRERESFVDRIAKATVLCPAHVDNAVMKDKAAKRLCTGVETSQDNNRAYVTFHLESRLEHAMMLYKVEAEKFFAMKIGPEFLEVVVRADAEYVLCMGKLGGLVAADRSSWTLDRVETSPEEDKPHLVIKVELSKASGGRWKDIFTTWENYQMVEYMQESLADQKSKDKLQGQLQDGGDEIGEQ